MYAIRRLQWLRPSVMRFWEIGRWGARERAGAINSANDEADSRIGESARKDLLGRIGNFLLGNRLDVSARNLVISHAAFSGENLGLGRHILRREFERLPITQEWLEDIISGDPEFADRQEEFEEISTKLDQSLASFSETAKQASKATARYGVELSQHADGFAGGDAEGVFAVSLLKLTRSMLERTQRLETNMRSSGKEITSLRNHLARARRDAELDHLTGLPNRRAFETVLAREYRDAQASVDPLTIAICDIDRFKVINDNHGHDGGDRVIKAIAEALARISNDRCHVARHGGEEFVLLFRGLTVDEAKERLDAIRETFAQRHLINRDTDLPIGHVTFSGGLANVFGFPEPRAALAAADQALYRAKEQGRNQICLAA